MIEPVRQTLSASGHVLLIANMPAIGANFRVGKRSDMQDGKLDVMFFQDATKLELLSYMYQGIREGIIKDKKIKHALATNVRVKVSPEMTLMFDGEPIAEGTIELGIDRHTLTVIIPKSSRVQQTTHR